MVWVMWWGLWEQPPSCLTHTHTHTHTHAHTHTHLASPAIRGSGWGKPLIHRLLSWAHTDTQKLSLTNTHTHTHTHTVTSWLSGLGGPGEIHSSLSVSLPPPLWHVVISRVQMFGDIFTHTWWQTTSVVSAACPSSNRLLQPWPDPQPVYKGSAPTCYLALFVKGQKQTGEKKKKKSISGKLDSWATEEIHLHFVLKMRMYSTE